MSKIKKLLGEDEYTAPKRLLIPFQNGHPFEDKIPEPCGKKG
jgi:hypothetical protein